MSAARSRTAALRSPGRDRGGPGAARGPLGGELRQVKWTAGRRATDENFPGKHPAPESGRQRLLPM